MVRHFAFENRWALQYGETLRVVSRYLGDAAREARQEGEAEVLSLLEMMPKGFAVRVHEGGGAEEPYASLAVSVLKLVDREKTLRADLEAAKNEYKVCPVCAYPGYKPNPCEICALRGQIDAAEQHVRVLRAAVEHNNPGQPHAAEGNEMSEPMGDEPKDQVYDDGHRIVYRTPETMATKGGAHAEYVVVERDPVDGVMTILGSIKFQHDTIPAVGVRGWTNESVGMVIIDRLEGFQAGEFACETNAIALEHFKAGVAALESRTKDRKERGVEGKHEA